jgi:hypothetical protein
MKTNSLFSTLLAVTGLCCCSASAAVFTTDTLIDVNDLAFEGQDIQVTGCTLTVNGPHSFNSLSLGLGSVLTHSAAATNKPDNKLELTIANDVAIDATSKIDVTGKGWSGLFSGPGAGGFGGHDGGGGGYGGDGAISISGGLGGRGYGSLTQPTDWGSPGGGSFWSAGNEGGGAIRLTVGGTMTINGQVIAGGIADWQPGDLEGGAGSGGSIYLTVVGTLVGSGSVLANGGLGDGDCSGGGGGGRIAIYYGVKSFIGTISAGGGASPFPGGAGTIFLKASVQTNGTVVVDNGGVMAAPAALLSPPGPYTLLITNGGAAYPSVPLTLDSLAIATNSTLTHMTGSTGLVVTVLGNATIDAGGAVSVAGKGYPSGATPGPGVGQNGNYAGGGSHGGVGGTGYYGLTGGAAYGSILQPVALGSAGGGYGGVNSGGAGGGAVCLTVNGTLTLNGRLAADGGNVVELHGGGGAGGSLWVTAGTLQGNGSISADGGAAVATDGGGGGGGRVALYYTNSTFAGTMSAFGGFGNQYGGAGTIYTKAINAATGDLLLANGNNAGPSTPVSSPAAFNLTIASQASACPQGALTVASLAILTNSTLTFSPGQSNVYLTVLANAVIASGGRLDVSRGGYADGAGPGAGQNGSWAGGGGYGGVGGMGYYGLAGGTTYGSILQPVDWGSGGGNWYYPGSGGPGGGAMRLIVQGTLTVNGIVAADGGPVGEVGGGGGAGGSLWLTIGTLQGGGIISANGGVAGASDGGGGGGGRVAVYYTGNTFTGMMSAHGGYGNQYGGAGSIYSQASGAATGNLLVENGNHAGAITPLSTPTAFNLTIASNAMVYPQGALTMASLNIFSNGVLTYLSKPAYLHFTVLGDALIASGGRLDASSGGYADGAGPGAGQNGSWAGGGGYGGVGGRGYYGLAGGTTYGSSVQPVDCGSGGGKWYYPGSGGLGGGAMRLIVQGTLTVNGTVAADGGPVGELHGGGGAGGSLWLEATTLAGTGVISAYGGFAVATDGGGGGGGRIALYYGNNAFAGTVAVDGGPGNESGGAGTIYLSSSMVPLTITGALPNGDVRPWADFVDVVFSDALNPGTIGATNFILTTPSGNVPAAQISVVNQGGWTWRASFPRQSADGHYQYQIKPPIQSLYGQALAGTYTGGFDISQSTWPKTVAQNLSGSALSLSVASIYGLNYQLLGSTNLIRWDNLGTARVGDGTTFTWTQSVTNAKFGFYILMMQ